MTASEPTASNAMRAMFRLAGVLVLGVGSFLFFFPGRTAAYFPWVVDPAISAAFLGSNYLAASVLQLWAARERRWWLARTAFPGVLLFTVLTAGISAAGVRHFAWRGNALAAASCVVWVAVYFLVPPIWGWIWLRQRAGIRRTTEPGPGRGRSILQLPSMLLAIAGVVLLAGAGMVFLPGAWPWDLNPPGSAYAGFMGMEPYIAAWLLGLGTVALMAATNPDAPHLGGVWDAAIALALLHGVTLARFRDSVEWNRPPAWMMVGVLGCLGLAGILARSRRADDPAAEPSTDASR